MSAWVHDWYRGGFVNIYEAGVVPWWVIADTRPLRFSLEGARIVDAFAHLMLAALPHRYETPEQALERLRRLGCL